MVEARRDADYLPWIETARSLLCVPIVLRAKVTGVIAPLDDGAGHFHARDAELLRAFAAHAAVALETDRLFRAMESGRLARTRSRLVRPECVYVRTVSAHVAIPGPAPRRCRPGGFARNSGA